MTISSASRPGVLGPNVAGSWYPAGEEALTHQVEGHLAAAAAAGSGKAPVRALIAPHAGFAYSGDVAGRTFREIRGASHPTVLLLGPSHYAAFEGAAVPAADLYRTPLGDVRIDAGAVAALGERPGIRIDDGPFREEHSLEAEIPFLQRCLGEGFRLLPVLVGGGSRPASNLAVADSLRSVLRADTLTVVSSDFTHYGFRFGFVPFADDVPRRIRALDMGAVDRIVAMDADGFDDYTRKTGITICGRAPISVLLRLLPPEVEPALVAYDTSGRMTGDWKHTVSYAGLAFRDRPT